MLGFTNMILICVFVISIVYNPIIVGLSCCDNILEEGCRRACKQMVITGNHIQQIDQILTSSKKCGSELIEFWRCVNTSIPVVHSIAQWNGRACCDLAVRRHCKQACQQASSIENVEGECSRSIERNLFTCLDKAGGSTRCCKLSSEYSCQLVCQAMFTKDTMTRQEQRHVLRGQCPGTSKSIMQCLQHRVKTPRDSNPVDSLPCCSRATTEACKSTCAMTLMSMKNNEHIVEELVKTCGPALPYEPIWACFLSNQNQDPPVEPKIMDGSRLHCCSKAATERCMNLCSKTFNTEWYSVWEDFSSKCQDLSLPVSMTEASMLTCLDEVEYPCKLGCSGLKFCRNFNLRPTQPFRSCNAQADSAAEKDIQAWEKGNIILPQMIIPVKDIRECEPDMWKAIACALHTKPCHKKPSHLPLCRNECMYILNKCVDPSRLQKGHTVQHLCNKLSTDDNHGSCVSLIPFLNPSKATNIEEVTTPCNPNPCPEDEVCWINRRKCRHPDNCKQYVCHKACRMGDISDVLVPRHSHVRIPLYMEGRTNDQCFEHQVCACEQNHLQNCKTIPCFRRESCVLGQTAIIKEHGEQFKLDCNHCICNQGEIICTNQKCVSSQSMDHTQRRELPCECSREYMPRCGHNGKTYPNPCLAERCGGLKKSEIREGACHIYNECEKNPCRDRYKCVPKRQVCLSINYDSCPQYECVLIVPSHKSCDHHHHDPVCDTTGEEYSNPCLLIQHEKTLDYRGHCQTGCSTSERVCGHNGETYPHECAALADRVTVDYYGECRLIGQYMGNSSRSNECGNVRCVPVQPSNCQPVLPPGTCCPVCAAELRMLFSTDMVDVMTNSRQSGPITVNSILSILSRQLMVRECDVFGYLNVETDLVVLIKPISSSPSRLQVEACIKEAERIEYLIQTDSPLLKSFVTMTPLLLATIRTPGTAQSGALPLSGAGVPVQSVLLTALVVIILVRRTFS